MRTIERLITLYCSFFILLSLGLSSFFVHSLFRYDDFSELTLTETQLVQALKNNRDEPLLLEKFAAQQHHLKEVGYKNVLILKDLSRQSPEALADLMEQYLKTQHQYIVEKRAKLRIALCILMSATSLITLISLIYMRSLVMSRILRPLGHFGRLLKSCLQADFSYERFVANPSLAHLPPVYQKMINRLSKGLDRFQQLDQMKTDFVNMASHELRTPLASIKGSLNLLGKRDQFDPNSRRLIQIAESETDRLIRLTNDILDLAKCEANELTLNRNWLSVKNLLEETCSSLIGYQEIMGVSCLVDDVAPSLEIYADADKMRQILTNLVANAIKFSPKHMTVKIFCELDQDLGLFVGVKDSGPGIPLLDQEKIFQKFRQINTRASDVGRVAGTGLGLAIAKALVQSHEGHIGINSHINQGSTFFFTLPKWRKRKEETPFYEYKSHKGLLAA